MVIIELSDKASNYPGFLRVLGESFFMALFGLPFTFAAVVFVAWPLHLLLRSKHIHSLSAYLVPAVFVSLVFALLTAGLGEWKLLIMCVVSAVFVSVSFWYFVRPRSDMPSNNPLNTEASDAGSG